MLILPLLLSCDLSGRVRCDAAREVEDRAWSEARDWYARMGAEAEQVADSQESRLRSSSAERESAGQAQSAYSQRTRGGLVDLRTGQVRANDGAKSANRGRAAVAAERVELSADDEALAAAEWVEAARRAQNLRQAAELVRAIERGQESLERADELRDTTLTAQAAQARRSRQSVCDDGSR